MSSDMVRIDEWDNNIKDGDTNFDLKINGNFTLQLPLPLHVGKLMGTDTISVWGVDLRTHKSLPTNVATKWVQLLMLGEVDSMNKNHMYASIMKMGTDDYVLRTYVSKELIMEQLLGGDTKTPRFIK